MTVETAVSFAVFQGHSQLTFVGSLASGCSVGDSNDEQRLLELVGTSGTKEERLEDLLLHGGSQGRQPCTSVTLQGGRKPCTARRTAELDLLDERHGSLFGIDVVSLSLTIEESDLAAVSSMRPSP